MFLNNYWKIKSMYETYPQTYHANKTETKGYDVGVKKPDGTSAGYITAQMSDGGMTYTDWQNGIMKSLGILLGVGNAVKLATGDYTISADDYTIGGTDVTSDFSGLSLSVTINASSGGEDIVCVIAGTYNGAESIEVTRVGITKDVYREDSATVNNNSSPKHTPVLIVEHELTQSITLNNGDPLNIVLKVTQS